MTLLAFIGLVVVLSSFVGLYIYLSINPESPVPEKKAEPKFHFVSHVVQATSCGDCTWRSPDTCKQCKSTKMEIEHPHPENQFCPPNTKCEDCMWKDCC